MVAEVLDAEQKIDLLIAQWSEGEGSAVQDFVRGVLQIVQDEIVQPLRTLERMASLDTATGIWLDRIGERLGFTRPTRDDQSIERFGYAGSRGKGFDQAPFYSTDPQAAGRVPVGDDEYRSILRARAQALIGAGNRTSVAAAAALLFNGAVTITAGTAAIAVDANDSRDEYGAILEHIYPEVLGLPAGITRTLAVT